MGKVWVEFQATISIFIELNSHLQAFLSTVPFQTLIIPLVVRRKNTVGLFRSITDFFCVCVLCKTETTDISNTCRFLSLRVIRRI